MDMNKLTGYAFFRTAVLRIVGAIRFEGDFLWAFTGNGRLLTHCSGDWPDGLAGSFAMHWWSWWERQARDADGYWMAMDEIDRAWRFSERACRHQNNDLNFWKRRRLQKHTDEKFEKYFNTSNIPQQYENFTRFSEKNYRTPINATCSMQRHRQLSINDAISSKRRQQGWPLVTHQTINRFNQNQTDLATTS